MNVKIKLRDFLPGNTAVNVVLVVVSVIMSVLAFFCTNAATQALLAGLGASFFVAGFIGIINIQVLSKELSKVTKEPFEDATIYMKIRNAGILNVYRNRNDALGYIFEEITNERQEIVIIGSSLKGLIGVGENVSQNYQRFRNILINAVLRGATLNFLLTNPEIAHHRELQEGRNSGDIEYEIIQNLIYLLGIKIDNRKNDFRLNIKLYNGTPTIFMIATTNRMIINPYTYYSTAFSSFTFLIDGETELYKSYYCNHYQEAWKDSDLTFSFNSSFSKANDEISEFINKKHPHNKDVYIIQDDKKRKELLDYLGKNKAKIENIGNKKQ
jgi:hypothetical protein